MNQYPQGEVALLIGAKDAANRLGISERTLFTLTKSRQIPSVLIGRRRLYCPLALRTWVQARMNAGGAAALQQPDVGP